MALKFTKEIVVILLSISLSGNAQDAHNIKLSSAMQLTKEDSIALATLPVLTIPEYLTKAFLPYSLDNSGQPYFRDLFEQVSNECGQYAGIAFNFTYELNYQRGISAKVPENQYPTHFTYNFNNGGYGWHGVSYFHSFEIVRTNGHPNIVDYGGSDATGGQSRWLTGYDKYYHGMFNRIDSIYQIQCNTPEGLEILKHWLFDHLAGEDVGGIACFYSASPWNATTLPAGTPGAGKYVIKKFQGAAGHSSTITGWNDSIRYDYNSDGLYTNDIDINNDGIVDMKDWEIGGLLFTDSYIGGVNWADSGFCFMMYKTLADNVGEGGIWNHAAHVVKVKKDYEPLLTMKIKLKHNSRDKIKIVAGVSEDINSQSPLHTLGFPIFNFQGGHQFMQGGTANEANKTIEFGLDITPLLGYITSGESAKFFLQVIEDDLGNLGTGQIIKYSLIDYTQDPPVETYYPEVNIPIEGNSVTNLSLTSTITFNQPIISGSSIPVALTGEPYNYQFEAVGGTPPYKWNLAHHYEQSGFDGDFPSVQQEQLTPTNNESGYAVKVLNFSFPFYGEYFDTLFIHADGFIMFDDQDFPWPYLYDHQLMLKKTRSIAPLLCRFFNIVPENGDGIWYEGDENSATFRWKSTLAISPYTENVNFAVKLYPSGNIEFFYGDAGVLVPHLWSSGISNGDDINYYFSDILGNYKSSNDIRFMSSVFPEELTLSSSGLLTGTPLKNYYGMDVEVVVTDYENIPARKTFKFYSWYAGMDETDLDNQVLNCFPNPFSSKTIISFELKNPDLISLEIKDLRGRQVSILADKHLVSGKHNFIWDGRNIGGDKQLNGVYFVILKAGNKIWSRKIILL